MNINKVFDNIKKEFELDTELELSKALGISEKTLKNHRQEKEITERKMSNLILKVIAQSESQISKDSIKPIVEFYPINFTASKKENSWKILSNDKDNYPDDIKLRKELDTYIEGIYCFYNSEGKIIYIGKTHNNLWKEINDAFNRYRKTQKLYRVNHNTKQKTLREVNVKLHDIAHYFSVYETHHSLTHNLETFLIRAIPNNLTNISMGYFIN